MKFEVTYLIKLELEANSPEECQKNIVDQVGFAVGNPLNGEVYPFKSEIAALRCIDNVVFVNFRPEIPDFKAKK